VAHLVPSMLGAMSRHAASLPPSSAVVASISSASSISYHHPLVSGRRLLAAPPPPVAGLVANTSYTSSSASTPTLTPTPRLTPRLTPEVTPLRALTPDVPTPFLDALVNSSPVEEALSMVANLLVSQDCSAPMQEISSRLQVSPLLEAGLEASAEVAPDAHKHRGSKSEGTGLQARLSKAAPRTKAIGVPFDIARKSVRARLAPTAQPSVERRVGKKENSHTSGNAASPTGSRSGRKAQPTCRARSADTELGLSGGRYGGQPRQSPRAPIHRQSSPSPPPRSCRRDFSSPQSGASSSSSSTAKVSSPRSEMQWSTRNTRSAKTEAPSSPNLRTKTPPWSIATPKTTPAWSSSFPKLPSRPSNLSRVAEEYDNDVFPVSAHHEALASALSSMESSVRSLYEDKVSESTRRILRGSKSGSLSPPALRKARDPKACEGGLSSIRSSSSSTSAFVAQGRHFEDVFDQTGEFGVISQDSAWSSEAALTDDNRYEGTQKPSRWLSARLVNEEQTMPMLGGDKLSRPTSACSGQADLPSHAERAGGDKLNAPSDCIDEDEIPAYLDYIGAEKLLGPQDCIAYMSEIGDADLLGATQEGDGEKPFVDPLDKEKLLLADRSFEAHLDDASSEHLLVPTDSIDDVTIGSDGVLGSSRECIADLNAAFYQVRASDENSFPMSYTEEEGILPSYSGRSGDEEPLDDLPADLEYAPGSISPSRNSSIHNEVLCGPGSSDIPCSDLKQVPTLLLPKVCLGEGGSIPHICADESLLAEQDMQEHEKAVEWRTSSSPAFWDLAPLSDPLVVQPPHQSVSINELRNRMEKLMAVLSPSTPLDTPRQVVE